MLSALLVWRLSPVGSQNAAAARQIRQTMMAGVAQDPAKRAAVLDVANSRHFRGRQQFGEAATRRAAAGLHWTQPRYPSTCKVSVIIVFVCVKSV